MKRVFLSYSRKDLGFVKKLAKDLQQAGYDVWHDLSDLEGGDRWAREIQAGIEQCDAFITVMSPNSMVSDWVEKEFLYASNARKNMVPLMYERCKLPIWILDVHYIDIKGKNYKKNYPLILAAIEDLEQPVTPPEPAKGLAGFSPIWIGGIAGGIVLALSALFGLRALMGGAEVESATLASLDSLSTAAAQTLQAGQATSIPVVIVTTATPIFILSATPSTPEVATELIATPTLSLAITDSEDVQLLLVPAGGFYMGSEQGSKSEAPIHVVDLDNFYIDKYEVTNEQYEKCVKAQACDLPTNQRAYFDDHRRFKHHPVVYVNWEMANAYCKWRDARLPTEAEWEKAARGSDLLEYPWGNQFNGKFLNFCDAKCSFGGNNGPNDGHEITAPVGSYEKGKSPYGIYDMAGNVREWVADLYSESYYAGSPKRNPPGPLPGTVADVIRVLRGGSWVDNMNSVRTFTRGYLKPDEANSYVGFRCVVDAVP